MRVLITVASRHGATEEIAAVIGRTLEEHGVRVEILPPARVESVERFDAVILGSGLYYGRWLPEATSLVEELRETLAARPLWLFSSGPLGSPEPKPENEPRQLEELARELGAREHRIFAGELERGDLSLAERAVVRIVHAQEGDFRDWSEVTGWANGIAEELAKVSIPA